jgi:Protein of unknown function DUF262
MTYKIDIEDSADLDTIEDRPLEFWEEKQKELVTSVVDYNLSSLSDLVKSGSIDLSPKYQRRYRWDNNRKSKLIESLLMNVPVPPIFLNEDAYGQYSVIDGKQRLTAISEFMSNRLTLAGLEIFSDINGRRFSDLPSKFQTVIKTRPTLRAIIVLRQSDEDVKFEVFQRLNTGGVAANSQEIRNSTYPGRFNDLILKLSERSEFHNLLGIKDKSKSAIYMEMRDVEFVLRYFTFRKNWNNFSGRGIKDSMDRFMTSNQNPSDDSLLEMEKSFLDTLKCVKAAFGNEAFRRFLVEKRTWRKQVIAALFDAQMFACDGRIDQIASIKKNSSKIIASLEKAFEDPTFDESISGATNNIGKFRFRIEKIKKILDETI